MIRYKEKENGLTFELRVQPNAPRTKILGDHDGALKLALAAPPVDGKANLECIRFLAKFFAVARGDVEILSGETNRNKVIFVRTLSPKQFEEKLADV